MKRLFRRKKRIAIVNGQQDHKEQPTRFYEIVVTERQHTILNMFIYGRLSQKEIAKRLNCCQSNVSLILRKVQEKYPTLMIQKQHKRKRKFNIPTEYLRKNKPNQHTKEALTE